jgi:adenosylcobinamide kinase / adenosylcobinamide-phosphate guanylyltransferase
MRIAGKTKREAAMKTMTFILGGARSGKSRLAQEMAAKAKTVLFVATASADDEDMQNRIAKHQADRPAHWHTLEAGLHIGDIIDAAFQNEELVLIDCITLLVSNILCQYTDEQFAALSENVLEKQVYEEIQELQECIKSLPASFIIVSNEVGLDIVPDNRLGRLYRDLLGRANQTLAHSADEVYFMVAGIPLRVKPQRN